MTKRYLALSGRIRQELCEIAMVIDRAEIGWRHQGMIFIWIVLH